MYGLIARNVFKNFKWHIFEFFEKEFECYCQLRFLIYSGVCLLIIKAESIVIHTEINCKIVHFLDSQ